VRRRLAGAARCRLACFVSSGGYKPLVAQTRRWEMPLLGIYNWTPKTVDLFLRSNLRSMVKPDGNEVLSSRRIF